MPNKSQQSKADSKMLTQPQLSKQEGQRKEKKRGGGISPHPVGVLHQSAVHQPNLTKQASKLTKTEKNRISTEEIAKAGDPSFSGKSDQRECIGNRNVRGGGRPG